MESANSDIVVNGLKDCKIGIADCIPEQVRTTRVSGVVVG